mgnify:CR=1 FL=1
MHARSGYRSYRGELALLLALSAASCGGLSAAQQETDARYRKLFDRVRNLEKFTGSRECGPELQQLLADARAECPANSVSPPEPSPEVVEGDSALVTAAATAASEEEAGCGTEQLKGAIKRAERKLNPITDTSNKLTIKQKGARVSPIAYMLNKFSCRVMYLDPNSEKPAELRLEQLQELVQETSLPQTRYTILASTVRGEADAQHRADVMLRQLQARATHQKPEIDAGAGGHTRERFAHEPSQTRIGSNR